MHKHAHAPLPPPPHTPYPRFEVPFNIWCSKCGEMIAKGERFNAEKKAVGAYFSTKILEFSMRHHCGSNIVIRTDPKNAEYLVTEGARKKVSAWGVGGGWGKGGGVTDPCGSRECRVPAQCSLRGRVRK